MLVVEGTMFDLFQIVVEATGAMTVAAILSEQMTQLDPEIRRVGVVLCGGNVDLDRLPW